MSTAYAAIQTSAPAGGLVVAAGTVLLVGLRSWGLSAAAGLLVRDVRVICAGNEAIARTDHRAVWARLRVPTR